MSQPHLSWESLSTPPPHTRGTWESLPTALPDTMLPKAPLPSFPAATRVFEVLRRKAGCLRLTSSRCPSGLSRLIHVAPGILFLGRHWGQRPAFSRTRGENLF